MFFQRLKTPGLGHNSYLLGCGQGLAVVIDPRRDIEEYLRLARANELSIAYILETHRQEDFEFGSAPLAEITGAKIVSGCHELFGHTDIKLKDGDKLEVGTTRFIALETPGHTPESVTYAVYLEDAGDECWGAFTGDALFVGDTGRTDLPDPQKTGENAGILYDSVHAKIAPLGDQTLLYPAHGSGSACGGNISARDDSTLGIEKGTNAVFRKSRNEFRDHKLAEKMGRPPYFRHMEEVNLLPGRPLPSLATRQVLNPLEFQQRMKEGVVIDTRSPEAFAGAHIPSSYNIWLNGIPAVAGWVATRSTRIFLVVESPEDMEKAVTSLARIGIDAVAGVLLNGLESWREQGLPIAMLGTTSVRETADRMERGQVQLLDVRDEYEWNEGLIPGAVHHFFGYLEERLPQLPKDSDIVVYCSVGHRAGVAVSILKRHGFTHVHNMLGGFAAWQALDLPLAEAGNAKKQG